MNNEIIIASRASPLALKQSEILINLIPSIKTKVLEVVSKGDQIQNVSLQEVGGKGLFIKNLDYDNQVNHNILEQEINLNERI